MNESNAIGIDYSEAKLRVLVEEYITQQKSVFTLQGVCSYVLYWAMEDGHISGDGIFESNQLAESDCDRISQLLTKIVCEGRISVIGEYFEKLKN